MPKLTTKRCGKTGPEVGDEVFGGGRVFGKCGDFAFEVFMVNFVKDGLNGLVECDEVDHHAGCGVDRAAYGDINGVVVPMVCGMGAFSVEVMILFIRKGWEVEAVCGGECVRACEVGVFGAGAFGPEVREFVESQSGECDLGGDLGGDEVP